MPSTQDLRRRMRSVKATRQITKAMELVSAAKMRRASEATLASRPYVRRALEVLADLRRKPQEGKKDAEDFAHPFLGEREPEHTVVFVISSDRSLAGSYNANLTKQALELLRNETAAGRRVSFITMGRQIERTLAKAGATLLQSYPHTPTHPTAADLLPVTESLSKLFLDGTCDRVHVLYTDFRSLLAQDVKLAQLLPLQGMAKPELEEEREFIYEPNPRAVLDAVLPRLLEVTLYQYLQESLASEHASRRMAMKSASDNASDMIDDLTLTYNGIRQGNITREIAEIVGGASALEN